MQRVQDAALRGAAAGLSLRGGLHLVSYVLHLLLRGKRGQRAAAAGRPNALAMLRDTARWGAFLGSFSGAWPSKRGCTDACTLASGCGLGGAGCVQPRQRKSSSHWHSAAQACFASGMS